MTDIGLRALLCVSAHDAAEPAADWRRAASCLDEDPELFYPVGAGEAYQPQIADAKAVCARCHVRVTCLEDALDHESGGAELRFGIRGRLDGNERANVHRSRQRKAKREAVATVQGSRLDDIVLLLADGVAPENVALRLHSSLGTLSRYARRAGASDIARQFDHADRVVNPDSYRVRDRRANAAAKQKRASA